jgi:hypothetical protein
MFRYFFKSRYKGDKESPKYNSPIKANRLIKGKLIDSKGEVYIDKDAELHFVSENEKNIFFKVKTNKLPRDSQTEAKTGDVVYFSLEEFKNIFNVR